MTENEAIERIKCRMHTAEQVAGKGRMEDLDMAIKALEEVQRWHTSEINTEIKNVFANTSTQICHNCDHKDEYIVELEAEMEQYQTLEKRLTEMFGDQLSLETVVDEMERVLKEPGNPHPVNAKILTYEDAKVWEEYKAIGTPEECRAAVDKRTVKKPIRMDKCTCPSCGTHNEVWKKRRNTLPSDIVYCWHCGQAVEIFRRDEE